MIPKETIEEWKLVKKAATPGPYVEFFSHGKVSALMPAGRPGEICSFGKDAVAPNRDARFYRTACDAVPALIEEVEQLRARVEELEEHAAELDESVEYHRGLKDKLKQQNGKLRAKLDRIRKIADGNNFGSVEGLVKVKEIIDEPELPEEE